jgi:hypothetical protein
VSEDLVVPVSGEVVNLNDEGACAAAIQDIRIWESKLKEAKAILTAAIVEQARIEGVRSFSYTNGRRIEVSGGPKVEYDAAEIEEGLRALGMPEDRIREIVVEEVSYKVSARQAKRAASANEDYAKVIEGAKKVKNDAYYISIRKG